jgi:hypothetical protein
VIARALLNECRSEMFDFALSATMAKEEAGIINNSDDELQKILDEASSGNADTLIEVVLRHRAEQITSP